MRLVFVGYIRRGGVRVMLINVTVTAYLVGFPYGLRCQRGLKKENQRRNIGGINRGFVFWVCLSVVIHGIGNGEIPYGVRKGHRGGYQYLYAIPTAILFSAGYRYGYETNV